MVKYFHFHANDHTCDVPLISSRCTHVNNHTNHHCKKRCLIGGSKCWIHLLSDNYLRIKPSTIQNAGSGLFTQKRYNNTNRVFNTGEKICDYQGKTISHQNITQRYRDKTAPYCVALRYLDENGNEQHMSCTIFVRDMILVGTGIDRHIFLEYISGKVC